MTTLGEKVRTAFKREPIAFCLTAFILLTGAAGGFTARQILTAAPSASGAVNLASTTGTEGTSTALMRADASLGVQGILPVLKGGTGSSTGALTATGTITSPLFQSSQALSSGQQAVCLDAGCTVRLGTSGSPGYAFLDGSAGGDLRLNGAIKVVSYAGGAGRPACSNAVAGGRWDSLSGDGATAGAQWCSGADGFWHQVIVGDPFAAQGGSINITGTVTATGFINSGIPAMREVGAPSSTLGALSVAGSSCQYHATTLTLTGALTTDTCAANYATGLGTTALTLTCDVTATNTVSFRFCNHTAGAVAILTAQPYVARVMR